VTEGELFSKTVEVLVSFEVVTWALGVVSLNMDCSSSFPMLQN
jgi:hypothetical protein